MNRNLTSKVKECAYGIGADPRQYVGQAYRELREILARNKDFAKCIFKPEPTYLGETIPVSGSGDVTNDREDQIGKSNLFWCTLFLNKHTIITEVKKVAYSERELLARIIQCEAGGEGDNGMRAVASVF